MVIHGCREFIGISQFHVKSDFIRVERHAIETDVAKRAVAKVGRYSAAVASSNKHIMRVGHGPVADCRRPCAVGLAIVVNPNLVEVAVHDECEMHPLPCRHRDARINRQGMTRSRSRRVEAQRLSRASRTKELITRTFVARLCRHIAFADITWERGISLIAHPSRNGETLVCSDIEVFVMRNDHILVGAVESDVMRGLREGSRHSRQQGDKGKDFLHGDRIYWIKHQCIGCKISHYWKKAKNLWPFFGFSGFIIGNFCIFATETLVDDRNG